MAKEADSAAHRRALALFERLTGRPDDRDDVVAGEPPEVLAILSRLKAAERRAKVSFPTADDAETTRRILPLPDRVGNYRLAELIGEGGMGLVFAGVRDDGLFDHRVAIKLIHPDRFGASAIARFNRERRLLARLDHPHIARLIDGGVTDDGWPYIIMELIEGRTIERFVHDESRSPETIVGLLLGTAEALRAAHESLVIHGDIKPDNIMIRPDGTPRLLDFGVARLANLEPPSGLTGRTAAFCAPEVLRGDSSTLRSDIYGFGMLMRALLPNATSSSTGAARIADRTLEAIAAKASADNPADRYEHVGDLASDLRRWRSCLPVSARRPNVKYTIGLFMRRHLLASAIVLALLIALAVAFAATIAAWRSASARIEDLRTLTHFQLVELDSRLRSLPNSIELRTRLAVEAQSYLGRLALDTGSSDALRREAADGFRRLALLQGAVDRPSLGDPIAARTSFAKALAAMPSGPSAENRSLRATILTDAAKVASGDAQPALAARLLDEARPLVVGDVERARYLLTLSEVEQWKGHYARASGSAEEAAALLATAPATPEVMAMRISAIDLTAEASYYAGDRTRARAVYRRALALASDAVQHWPGDQRLRWSLEKASWALGTTVLESGYPQMAAPLLEGAYASSRLAAAADPGDGAAQRRYRSFMLAYGQGLIGSRTADGLTLIRRSQHLREQWWRRSPSDEGRRRDWLVATLALGDALTQTHDRVGACNTYKQAQALIKSLNAERRLLPLDAGRLTVEVQHGGTPIGCFAQPRS